MEVTVDHVPAYCTKNNIYSSGLAWDRLSSGQKTIFIIHTGEAKCVILCGTTVLFSENSSVLQLITSNCRFIHHRLTFSNM